MPFAQRALTLEAQTRVREKDRLSASYDRSRRERINALCEGPNGEDVKALVRFLRAMTLQSGAELVALLEAADWARRMSSADRGLLLSIISGSIRLLRERNGLSPFDDPLWDQPPNVFQRCKDLLEVR